MRISNNLLMVKYLPLLLISLFFLSNGLGYCQNIQPKDVVSIGTKIFRDSLKTKDLLYLNVILNIKDGWHINANKPLDEYLTPTTVTLDSSKYFKILNVKYPAPQYKKLDFSDKLLALYVEQATVEFTLKIIKPGEVPGGKFKGEVGYQPCNNQTCLFPVKKDFYIDLNNKK